jgi:uncharacterized protein YqcC (DUF446 family)
MSARHADLAALLRELEGAMHGAALWDALPPSPAALESVEPFCVDTLSLPQWLQWIFLPRMRALLDARAALPAKCGIAAMAEVYFLGREDAAALRVVEALRGIDRAIEGPQKL